MQPQTRRALENWRTAWTDQQDAAMAAFAAAFPGLARMDRPTGCCHPRLKVERLGEATGFVCFDDHGRATVDFAGIPQTTAAAPPGIYNWDDEATYAEFEIEVAADATASICMSYVTVEDAVVLLDELQTHLVGRTGDPEQS